MLCIKQQEKKNQWNIPKSTDVAHASTWWLGSANLGWPLSAGS